MSNRKPISRREYIALMHLVGAADAMSACTETLAGRAPSIREALETVAKAFDEALRTIPVDKLERIKWDLRNTRIYTKVEAPGIVTVKPEHYRYVPSRDLNMACDLIADEHCYLCDKSAVEGRKCPVKEVLEALLPHELGYHAGDGCCPWSGLKLGLGEIEDGP